MMRLTNLDLCRPCIAAALAVNVAEAAGVSPHSAEAFARAKAELHQAAQDGRVVGAAHLVVQNGKALHAEAVGFNDVKARTPFTVDSILRIYSMSKPITSVAAMMLDRCPQAADGRTRWGCSIRRVRPAQPLG